MKIRPLYDRIVIQRLEEKETVRGSIIIPDSAKEKPQEGEVIAIGEGRWKSKDDDYRSSKKKTAAEDKIYVKTTLKPGDKVLYERYAGSKVTIDNEDFVMVREENVLGILA